jgi:hypothetical protein
VSNVQHIAVICHQYPPTSTGGLAEYAKRSLSQLHQLHPDVKITVYTMNYPGSQPNVSTDDGFEVHRPWISGFLKSRNLGTRI